MCVCVYVCVCVYTAGIVGMLAVTLASDELGGGVEGPDEQVDSIDSRPWATGVWGLKLLMYGALSLS